MTILRIVFLLALLIASAVSDDRAIVPEAKLLMACMSGGSTDKLDAVKQAIEDGADIDILDKKSGQTPLMAAILRGKVDTVEYLLKQGADVTIPEKDGYTPAHGAAFQGRPEIMEMLHNWGIDVLVDQHEDGFHPLHRACWGEKSGHAKVVEVLLKAGVDPHLESSDGKRCIEMTTNKKVKKVLAKYGADDARPEHMDDQEF